MPLLQISNLLSIARMFLAVPAVWAIVQDERTVAVTLFFVAAATDYLDGWFARRLNQITELGKLLDPIADKIFVAAMAVVMLAVGRIPLWLVVVILARDLIILVGGLVVERKTGRVLPSNWTGKWAVGVLSITMLLLYVGVEGIAVTIFIILTLVMLAVSLFMYGKRMWEVLRSDEAK